MQRQCVKSSRGLVTTSPNLSNLRPKTLSKKGSDEAHTMHVSHDL